MSYLDVINAFWRYNRRERLEPTTTLTYLWVLDLWNRTGRKEWFTYTLAYLADDLGISKSTAKRNVHKLARKGLLKVQKSHRRAPNKYLINTGLFESLCRQRTTNEPTNGTQVKHKRNTSEPITERYRDKEKYMGRGNGMGRGTVPSPPTPCKPSPPPGNGHKPKPRLFLSELKAKREALAEELKELANRGFEDAWGVHYRKEDLPRVQAVKAQMKALRRQIVEY